MALKSHSKKHLTKLLEHLEESHSQLQQLLCDFVTQILTNTKNWMANPDNNMTFKEAVAKVTAANTTLLEYIERIPDDPRLSPELKLSESENVPPPSCPHDSCAAVSANVLMKLEMVETTLSSLRNTQRIEAIEQTMSTQQENVSTWQCDIEEWLKTLSKTQTQHFQMLQTQLNERDRNSNKVNKDIVSLKENQINVNNEIEKLSLKVQENENKFQKMCEDLQIQSDSNNNMKLEIKRHSDVIFNMGINAKANSLLRSNIQNLSSKYSMICNIVQQRLMPIDQLMQMLNQISTTSRQKWTKVESIEKDIVNMSMEIRSIGVLSSALGFIALGSETDKSTSLLQFHVVWSNIGKHFNPKTGRFTAPCDGIYIAHLAVRQASDKSIKMLLECQHKQGTENIGNVNATPEHKQASCSPVFAMERGDVLCFLSLESEEYIGECKFSCFLLKIN
ncbi:uncharacterized protein LOC131948785 isoform X2 [Physella acuta]|uniref:uncharacterized protein LOC131948785 isoform X2 n=1 Tax=Physella acuta TaxID=109671 RepID=UPI0027DCBA88|nr:uncharacterized protein LOC131948785 isoform X2 [Physella acuta]